MSNKVAKNRFIVSPFENSDKLYQYLLSNIVDFQRLGAQLVLGAKKAQALRQISKLEEIGTILSRYPIREYQLIGQYYLGWCEYRKGKDAKAVFENIVENSTTYKSMALIDLATLELSAGNCNSGIKFCEEAIRHSHTVSAIINAARSIAVIKSAEGCNKAALKRLEAIAPLARYATPIVRCQYLNSLAVEYGETGRVEEAGDICKVTLASPYAFAYPEWRETGQDLALRGYKSRSSVPIIKSIPRISGNVSFISERERSEGHRPSLFDYPRGVTKIADWKKKMVKKNGEEINIDEMSDKDLLFEIMNIASEESITREQLQEILDAARKAISKKP